MRLVLGNLHPAVHPRKSSDATGWVSISSFIKNKPSDPKAWGGFWQQQHGTNKTRGS